MSLDSRFLDSPKMVNRGLIRTRIVANLWGFLGESWLDLHSNLARIALDSPESLLES